MSLLHGNITLSQIEDIRAKTYIRDPNHKIYNTALAFGCFLGAQGIDQETTGNSMNLDFTQDLQELV